jgi:hypothetical protein
LGPGGKALLPQDLMLMLRAVLNEAPDLFEAVPAAA